MKEIPGYNIYRINEDGSVIECYINNTVQFVVKDFESKTSKGTYKTVNILNNKLKHKFKSVHQLVCLAYNGYPPKDGNYVVNHKDGNKHNNYYKNLEWVKSSENSFHALKNGLRSDNIFVNVTDTITNKTYKIYSIIELARRLNIPRSSLYAAIGRSNNGVFFEDRYKIDINIESFGKVIRKNSNKTNIYDYVKSVYITAHSLNMCAAITGIKQSTIRYMLIDNDAIELAGYKIYRYSNKNRDINNNITQKDAMADRLLYYKNNPIENKDTCNDINIALNEHN